MSGHQNSFEPHIEPKNSPLGPQKVKDNHKIKSKLKVKNEENIEIKSYSTTVLEPKTVF